jgi:predicted dehydrogenase
MKQIVQNLRTGETILENVPAPMVRKGCVLIRTRVSLVSNGTERMLVEFGKANIFQKALQQPDRVRMVLNKVKTDGLIPTFRAVSDKLDQSVAIGYCNVGEVIAVGEGVSDVRIGARVTSNGPHAEIVCIPRNLVAKIPDQVSDEEAAFTVPAAIGLHAIRLLKPQLGETVVVIGLGLIGLLTADLLKVSGCRVIGIDFDNEKLKIAAARGVIPWDASHGNAEEFICNLTQNLGADGVIVAASSGSNDAASQAVRVVRRNGKIVITGAVGLELNRNEMYKKEVSLIVSRSYGPGRYDPDYEEKGLDYPSEYVRWTENRNFQAILQTMSAGLLELKSLISKEISIDKFAEVYDNLAESRTIGTVFTYSAAGAVERVICTSNKKIVPSKGVIGIIGAGNFVRKTLLPVVQDANIKYISSANGLTATALARKFNIPYATTDYRKILEDDEVDLVCIATRHNLHEALVLEALQTGKHVFVEKPLAIYEEELASIADVYQKTENCNTSLNIGFNRRFSPHTIKIKSLLGDARMNVVTIVNAGMMPPEAWVHDRSIGGGRILGEVCHFIDLASYLTGSQVVSVFANGMDISETSDNLSIFLSHANGSTATIHYFSNGTKIYPKERIEVFSLGRILILDNFRKLTGYGFNGFSVLRTESDKGHKMQFKKLLQRIQSGGEPIIPFSEIVNTTKASFAILESLKSGKTVNI